MAVGQVGPNIQNARKRVETENKHEQGHVPIPIHQTEGETVWEILLTLKLVYNQCVQVKTLFQLYFFKTTN